MNTIDLHIHTSASDGSYTPTELVDYAVRKNLSAIAITDHDTMRGIREAREHIKNKGLALELIPGMEVSTSYPPSPYGIHVLAYFKDKEDTELANILDGIEDELDYGMSPEDAIKVIHSYGGIAVMAHPKDCFLSMERFDKLAKALADIGLDGIECYYTTHSDAETKQFKEIAVRHGLIITGGTDFHGTGKPGVDLGSGFGSLTIPYDLVSSIDEKSSVSA